MYGKYSVMEIKFIKASKRDFNFIKKTDKICFMHCQQTSDNAFLRSLNSSCRDIFIVKIRRNNKWEKVAFFILHKYVTTLRIISLAVLPEYRKLNIGNQIIQFSIDFASRNSFDVISLEVLATNNKLIEWYEQFGFKTYDYLHDYYEEHIDGFRMRLGLSAVLQ